MAKKALSSIIIICVLFMSLGSICYATTIQPVISAECGRVGDTITVTISLPDNTNAAGGSFNLIYDNSKMELIDSTEGDIISGFSATINETYGQDRVRLNFAGSKAVPATGGVLLNATFRLTASGTAVFSTENFKLCDINTKALTCNNITHDIIISDSAVFTPVITTENGIINDIITVSISIPENTNAAGGSFNLIYDNSKMELIDAAEGDVISGFASTINKNYGYNKLRLNFAGSKAVPVSGGVILNATFRLIASGTAVFSTENFKLNDIGLNPLTCTNTTQNTIISDSDVFAPVITTENGIIGDIITVTVSLPKNTNAAAGSFNLIYDSSKMELIDATAGDTISGHSNNVNKTYESNKIRLNFAGSKPVPANGGVILNATFRLIESGTTVLSTEKFKLADINTKYLNCENSSQNITIKTPIVTVTGVLLNKTSSDLTVGDSETLVATVTPGNATNKKVTWSSSDNAVASVSDGVVTAKSAGTAVITATTEDGGYTADCTVTITDEHKDVFEITDFDNSNGIEFNVSVPSIDGYLFAAIYDASGKMIDVKISIAKSENHFSFSKTGKTVKVIWVDGALRPKLNFLTKSL